MSRILIADADKETRNLFRDLFKAKGHETTTASSGEEALGLITPDSPEIVFLGIHTPDEKSIAILKKMRSIRPMLPVVVFCNYLTRDLEKKVHEAGAVDVIHKDIGRSELASKIYRILSSVDRILGSAKPDAQKIMVVDDDESTRMLLTEFFMMEGLTCVEAAGGEEALALLKAEKPSAILLDMLMPGMNGIETLKQIRKMDPNVGVVMATGLKDEALANQAMAAGAYGYVIKPFDLEYLRLVVLTRLIISS